MNATRIFAASQPRSLAASAVLLLAIVAASAANAQVLPDPDRLAPFAPITYNGPVAGVGGVFAFASMNPGGTWTGSGFRLWVFNGNTAQQVPYPASFAAGVSVPFSVPPLSPIPPLPPLPPGLSILPNVYPHNGLAAVGLPTVDPAEDDNPQGLQSQNPPSGGRTMHHRRHRLVPTNQDLTSWLVVGEDEVDRLLISTVAKPALAPSQMSVMEGGVLTIDFMGSDSPGAPPTTAPPVATSVWPTNIGAVGATFGPTPPIPPPPPPYPNAVVYVPPASVQTAHPQVLSDLAPNVYSQFQADRPNAIAWVAGSQRVGDTPPPGGASSLLVLADYTSPGLTPSVATTLLQSPFAPYAEKLLVWNDLGGDLPFGIPQFVLVPCRDGVEIYDPALVGTGTELIKVVSAAAGKEICSNVSFFGPNAFDGEPATPYFIVLERDTGDLQSAGGGVNFIVFDLLTGSIPARGPIGTNGTMPGLVDTYGRPPLDVVRGCNDIAIAPPERDEFGESNPTPAHSSTAWFGVWDANTAVLATALSPAGLFGGLVGVENWGLGTYTDGGFGLNAAGPFPGGTNVRYFTPVRDASGTMFTSSIPDPDISYPIPVGEVSTNPIFNPLPGQGVVNQNLVTCYWENGSMDPDPSGTGTGFGVMVVDVPATWVSANPAYPGGILVDGTAGGTYPGMPDRSQEVLTERPLFGYVNYPAAAIVFAQRQCGIETFGGMLLSTLPRNIFALARFGPQTPPPTAQANGAEWLYQKRRHTAWNPPPEIHNLVNPAPGTLEHPFTWGLDTAIVIQAGEAWSPQAPHPRLDDWVSYFVNWRFDMTFGLLPWPQGAVFPDWAGARAGPNNLILLPGDATTAPPPTQKDFAFGPVVGFPYCSFAGQTPLWADWNLIGSSNSAYVGLDYRPVLRSHTNPFPIQFSTDNNAWVGIGAQQMLKYSFGRNEVASSSGTWPSGPPYPLGAPGRRSIIKAHIDQFDPTPGVPAAGLPPLPPPATGGPGQFRVNFLHIQAQQGAGAGPGFEATYVNNPLGGDWQFILPEGDVVSTEILAFTPP